MKYSSVLLAVGCLLSAVTAQWLETTIQLDSGATPMSICYNSADDKVYCANKDANNVTVIDAATNEVITTVAVGEHPYSICYDAPLNKVYCSGSTGSFITVIDGSTDSVDATIDVADGEYALFCNPQNNKVYGGRDASGVTVVDCVGDSVLTTVPAWGSPLAFCHNSRNNKVYYAAQFGDHVGVIDAATDSLLAEIPLEPGSDPYAVCYSPMSNKVYCSASNGNKVVVINGGSDSVVSEVQADAPHALGYNQQENKVYVGLHFGGVIVIDCATDSAVAAIPLEFGAGAFLHNANTNRVFCAGGSRVIAIDGAADTVLGTIEVDGYPIDMCYSPTYNRVYVANIGSSTISVIRDSTLGVDESPNPQALARKLEPTILSGASGVGRLASSVIFDAMGRRVQNPRSGIFFVREAVSGEPSAVGAHSVRKVVIAR